MSKHIVNRLFIRNGVIDVDAVMYQTPVHIYEGFESNQELLVDRLTKYAYDLVAKTKLPDGFIAGNITKLPVDSLFAFNRVPANVIMDNAKDIAIRILCLTDVEDIEDTLGDIFDAEYDIDVYEALFTEILNLTLTTPAEDDGEGMSALDIATVVARVNAAAFSDIVGANIEFFSREFILKYANTGRLNVLAAYIAHPEISIEDAMDYIDAISYEQLFDVVVGVPRLREQDPDNGLLELVTPEIEHSVKALMLAKLEKEV